jgi:nitrite reductase/ring-hydroxylating ferredoxin subunit
MNAEFQPVLSAQELPQGSMRVVEIQGREILLCHTKDGVSALDNICSHAYARLCEGRLRGTRLICPLHGASFDARSGQVLGPPASQALIVFAVRINDGVIEVAAAAAAAAR